MKKVNLIVQAKGGTGKSMLTYLLAIAKHHDEKCLIVDVDSSTKTSSRQTKFFGENRTEMLSLLNDREVLVRDKLISYLESVPELPFEELYLDLGSPESEQLPALLMRDLPLKEFCAEMDIKIEFYIVIGGGGAYTASINYLQKMQNVCKNDFEITVWMNITSFNNFSNLADELKSNCKKMNMKFRQFGDFEPSSALGSQILDGIRQGFSLSDYQTGARIKLKKELNDNFKNETNI